MAELQKYVEADEDTLMEKIRELPETFQSLSEMSEKLVAAADLIDSLEEVDLIDGVEEAFNTVKAAMEMVRVKIDSLTGKDSE